MAARSRYRADTKRGRRMITLWLDGPVWEKLERLRDGRTRTAAVVELILDAAFAAGIVDAITRDSDRPPP